jgi:hypothetical protein
MNMKEIKAKRDWFREYAKELRALAVTVDAEGDDLLLLRAEVLEDAARMADRVEMEARPGDGKDAAAEIGRRIRALMEGGAA